MTDEERDAKLDQVLTILTRILPVVEKLLKHPMLKRWLN